MQSNRRALKGSVLRGTKKSSMKVSIRCVIYHITHECVCSCANIIVCCINQSRSVQSKKKKCKTTSKSKSHKEPNKKQRLIVIILSIVKKVKEILALLKYIHYEDALVAIKMLLLDEQDMMNEMMATMSQEDAMTMMTILSTVEDTKSAVDSLPDGVIQVFAAIVGQQLLGYNDILLPPEAKEIFDLLGDENDLMAMLQFIGEAVGGVEYLNNEEGGKMNLIDDVNLSMSMSFVDGVEIEFGRRH